MAKEPIEFPENRDAFLEHAFAEDDGSCAAGLPSGGRQFDPSTRAATADEVNAYKRHNELLAATKQGFADVVEAVNGLEHTVRTKLLVEMVSAIAHSSQK